MKFKRILLKNIRSYEQVDIEFPEGSILLSGDIGSGKTTVLLAIEYALFGLQPGQKGSALLRNSAETGEVRLEMEIDGSEIVIERKLRRSSKGVTNEYSAITVNGEKEESSITEIKTQILELLNYPQEFIKKNNILYRYTVYTPQEQMKQIITEDPEIRLNILRHVFGIDKYKTIRENLAIFLNHLKEESKVYQGEIKLLDEDRLKLVTKFDRIKELEESLKRKQTSLEKSQSDRKKKEQELLELEEKITQKQNFEKEAEKTKILLTTKQENLFSLKRDEDDLNKTLLEYSEGFDETRFNQTTRGIQDLTTRLDQAQNQLIGLESQMQSVIQQEKDQTVKKSRISSLEICPTCLQSVSTTHKVKMLDDFERAARSFRSLLQTLSEEKKAILATMDSVKADLRKLERDKVELEIARSRITLVERSRVKITENKKIQESLEKDIQLLQKHLSSLKEQILKFSIYENHYKIKEEELKRAFISEKNEEIGYAELKKELELTRREISEIQQIIQKKEVIKKHLEKTLEIMDWLSNQFLTLVDYTEKSIMMKLRMEFSRLFNNWFKVLAAETFEVKLDETFTPLILQKEIEMEYGFLSGGERTALALAYRLALNQTVNSILSQIKTRDIVILDEPTDGFSDPQIDKMRDVFEELDIKQLIIVSHEQKIEGFVDNIIKITKNDLSSSAQTATNGKLNHKP